MSRQQDSPELFEQGFLSKKEYQDWRIKTLEVSLELIHIREGHTYCNVALMLVKQYNYLSPDKSRPRKQKKIREKALKNLEEAFKIFQTEESPVCLHNLISTIEYIYKETETERFQKLLERVKDTYRKLRYRYDST